MSNSTLLHLKCLPELFLLLLHQQQKKHLFHNLAPCFTLSAFPTCKLKLPLHCIIKSNFMFITCNLLLNYLNWLLPFFCSLPLSYHCTHYDAQFLATPSYGLTSGFIRRSPYVTKPTCCFAPSDEFVGSSVNAVWRGVERFEVGRFCSPYGVFRSWQTPAISQNKNG
jgi:hypothetical protein